MARLALVAGLQTMSQLCTPGLSLVSLFPSASGQCGSWSRTDKTQLSLALCVHSQYGIFVCKCNQMLLGGHVLSPVSCWTWSLVIVAFARRHEFPSFLFLCYPVHLLYLYIVWQISNTTWTTFGRSKSNWSTSQYCFTSSCVDSIVQSLTWLY